MEVDLGLTDFITGLYGSAGSLINNLQFTVQSGRTIPPCGGIYGKQKDVTPPAYIYGRCLLINIAGTTLPGISNNLATMQFLWACKK